MEKLMGDAYLRQKVVICARQHGICEAANIYGFSRKSVWRWMKQYNGTVSSLVMHSTRPLHHPNEHTKEEDELVRAVVESSEKKIGLDKLYMNLIQNYGYKRSRSTLYRVLRRLNINK
ncbi:MAG: hypothetical protein FWF47_03290 [Clostridia bacterium]|nr:hypothetical protein [Clostridia bacterium]